MRRSARMFSMNSRREGNEEGGQSGGNHNGFLEGKAKLPAVWSGTRPPPVDEDALYQQDRESDCS
jgi:hypothetical protein